MVCGVLLLACVAALLWAYREPLKGLIARLRGTTPPTP